MSGSVRHWWMMRVTSVLLIPLSLWFLWAGASLAGAEYSAALAFMAHPVNAIAAGLLGAIGLYHAQAGILTVVEDYVPGRGLSRFLMLITHLGSGLGVIAIIFVVFRLFAGA